MIKKALHTIFLCILVLLLAACGSRGASDTGDYESKEPAQDIGSGSTVTTPSVSESLDTDNPMEEGDIPPVNTDNDESLVWIIAPSLAYDNIRFFYNLGFIAYDNNNAMFVIDEKTGDIIAETGPSGGFYVPYSYGYHSDSDTFFYSLEYEYIPESTKTVVLESLDTIISVHELEMSYDHYEYKEDSKYAIFYNGEFVSGFIYDEVIGGNSMALVMNGGKYAFAGADGNLLTNFIFDDIAVIAKGYIAVKVGDYWGFVEASGKEVIPFIFEDAVNIDECAAFVKYNGMYGILDVSVTAKN